MAIAQTVMSKVVLPVGLRALQVARHPMGMLLHEDGRKNPYRYYDRIRQRGIVQAPVLGTLMIADHAGITEVLRDHGRFSHDYEAAGARMNEVPDQFQEAPKAKEMLLLMDPPDHTRVRRLVGKAFTPRAIESLDAWIGEQAEEFVGKAAASGSFDLIDDIALPLPLAVICKMLGVPLEDRDKFEHWGHEAAAGLDLQLDTSAMARTAEAELHVARYLGGLIEEHRREPRDDLLSALIAATDEGDRLTERELVATCVLLLIAGFETTVNLIGNGTLALIDNPAEHAKLRDDPSLLPNAVEEMLRYDSPVQLTSRVVGHDTELADGRKLARGHEIISLLGGANRDPAVFDAPNTFDVTRSNAGQHLSFSTGIHHCLGAALARMEARATFAALLRRDRLEQAGPAVRRPTMVLRGLSSLAVRVA